MRVSSVAASLFAAGALAQSSNSNTTSTSCAKGLYLIVARGTGEDKGTGSIGEVAERIAGRVRDSKIQALDYPATFTDPDYNDSEKQGVENLQNAITSYHGSCPNGKIAFLGYSQGGQLASDAFCGGEGGAFSDAKPLPTELVEDSVVAIITFGDPSHVANVTYNRGTSVKDGIFARDDVSKCEQYADRLRAYCDKGDVYCDIGEDRSIHGSYVKTYGDEVVDFVVKRFESSKGGSSATPAPTTARPTASSTGSGSGSGSGSPSGTPTAVVAPGSAAGLAPGLAAAVGLPLVALGLQMLA